MQIELLNFTPVQQETFSELNTLIGKNLASRVPLEKIDSVLLLDVNLEKLHETKFAIDMILKLLEEKKIELYYKLKREEEITKIEKLEYNIQFDLQNSNKKIGFTTKEWDRRKEKSLFDKFHKVETEQLSAKEILEILNLEIKDFERTKENINDIYMSLKKKYDAYIKLNIC